MTRPFSNAFALFLALLVTSTLILPAINTPADYGMLTSEIA